MSNTRNGMSALLSNTETLKRSIKVAIPVAVKYTYLYIVFSLTIFNFYFNVSFFAGSLVETDCRLPCYTDGANVSFFITKLLLLRFLYEL
jgi:hypothetical protein